MTVKIDLRREKLSPEEKMKIMKMMEKCAQQMEKECGLRLIYRDITSFLMIFNE